MQKRIVRINDEEREFILLRKRWLNYTNNPKKALYTFKSYEGDSYLNNKIKRGNTFIEGFYFEETSSGRKTNICFVTYTDYKLELDNIEETKMSILKSIDDFFGNFIKGCEYVKSLQEKN